MRWFPEPALQRIAGPGLIAGAALAATVFFASLAIERFSPVQTALLDPAAFRAEEGLAFTASLPLKTSWPFAIRSDAPRRIASRLLLTEDGRALGPSHAPHAAIRSQGLGQYSHWRGMVLFSTSDGTDPRRNGRVYAVSVKPHASASLGIAAGMIAFATLVLFWRRLVAFLQATGAKLALGSLLCLLAACLLVATGVVGRVVLGVDEPKDPALVMTLVWHAAVGVLITFVQCAVGAGAVRLLFRRDALAFSAALLLGFPISLLLVALAAVLSLALPWGALIAAFGLALLLAPLRHDVSRIQEWPRAAGIAAGLALPAVAFGIWLGLLWHGPTPSLPGMPSGDLVYYTSLVSTLHENPWPIRNWGNEGEVVLPFNALWPALGAALKGPLLLEPFAFVITSGATAFVLATFLMLLAYLRARRRAVSGLGGIVLALAFLSAARYPFWVVESIPQIHTSALTIAIWFWVTEGRNLRLGSIWGVLLALAGSMLTKVGSGVTLVTAALGALADTRPSSTALRLAGVAAAATAAAVGLLMVWKFAPGLLAVGGIGPETIKSGGRLRTVVPFALRDLGTILLVFAAYRIAPWWAAVSIIAGLLGGGLLVPFFLRTAYVSALILIGLCALDNQDGLARNRRLVLLGLALCLPAVVMTDAGGGLTGLAWLACIGAAACFALDPAPREWARGLVLGAATVCAFLIAVALGQVGMASNWIGGTQKLSPDVLRLWQQVRAVVPRDALVFTDQTGPDWGLLGGWNTYAFHAQRQLFISTWVQSGELQTDEPARLAKLRWNDRVLRGELAPAEVPLRGRYAAFYAVVRSERLAQMRGWVPVHSVGDHAILRWRGP